MTADPAVTQRRSAYPVALGLVVSLSSLGLLGAVVWALESRIRPLIAESAHAQALDWIELAVAVAAVGVLAAAVLRRSQRTAYGPGTTGQDAGTQGGELGTLMGAFARMVGTIEAQTGEINGFAQRLERAYAELEVTNARLKEFSFKDEVTGLYNRRFFGIRLEEEVSRYRRFGHPVAVVLLDLDGFKAINDELGHGAGDATLRDMAELLLKHSRGINVICRYGGDEFAVLLVETGKAGARLYAERIREVLSQHRFPHGRRVTASFGLASLPEDVAPGAEELIQAADEALYAAKRAGKNRVSVYEPAAPPSSQEVTRG